MNTQEKADKLTQAIIDTCKENGVEPQETLEVIGLAVCNILTTIAPLFGVTERQMLKTFAKGVAKAELIPIDPRNKN